MSRISIKKFIGLVLLSFNVHAAESIGKAISLEGQVTLKRGTSAEINIRPGDLVFEGDRAITGQRSNARFLMKDDSILDVKESTSFGFEKLNGSTSRRDAEFSLDFGRIRASVNKKINPGNNYKIKTKATVFAVRGTDFAVSADNSDNSKLTVFEGRVKSKSGARYTNVKQGFELESDGISFEKIQLNSSQIESVFQQSRTEDMTFYQNLVVEDFRSSRNFGAATIQTMSKLVAAPNVEIPKDSIKVPGVNDLNASVVSPGVLNYVITNVGVKIQ